MSAICDHLCKHKSKLQFDFSIFKTQQSVLIVCVGLIIRLLLKFMSFGIWSCNLQIGSVNFKHWPAIRRWHMDHGCIEEVNRYRVYQFIKGCHIETWLRDMVNNW